MPGPYGMEVSHVMYAEIISRVHDTQRVFASEFGLRKRNGMLLLLKVFASGTPFWTVVSQWLVLATP